jgi:hypothetical protein
MAKKNALKIYRALNKTEKISYDSSGLFNAGQVRELQKLAKGIARAKIKKHERVYILRAAPKLQREIDCKNTIIPLGKKHGYDAKFEALVKNPRLKNWEAPVAANISTAYGMSSEGFNYKGVHRGRVGYNYTPQMRSIARVSADGSVLGAVIADQQIALVAPRGYRWASDANGIKIVRNRDGADYHPSSGDIVAGIKSIVAILVANATKRAETKKAAARDAKILKQASKNGIYVCLADSISAGNCSYGSRAFAQRHNLNINSHYLAKNLPQPTNNEESRRLALAVIAAQRRQAVELRDGFCKI